MLHGPAAGPGAPLLIIAGAGTGKTLTLSSRVARLVLDGADPNRLLLMTFSRRAALELVQRTGRVLHRALALGATVPAPSLPWAGTFHSVGARLLREHAEQIGLARSFTLLDQADAQDLMAMVRQAQGLAQTHQRFPLKGTCNAIYSRVINTGDPLPTVLAEHFPWCASWEAELKGLFRGYVGAKQEQQVLDYDDLLLYWARMLEAPGIASLVAGRFDHVLVDEYQDTNRLQARILRGLKADGKGVAVVGDDAQAIYGFRGAEVRNILEFPQQFEPAAAVLRLEQNYRSTSPILAVANAVIEQSSERHAKRLWTNREHGPRPQLVRVDDEMAQARWVADRVLQLREEGIALRRQAVLFRTAHHSAALQLELMRRDIPFVMFGGLRFLEAAHVKDVMSVLRWASNPKSRLAGFRVAQLLPGMGPATARRLVDTMQAQVDPLAALRAFKPSQATRQAWDPFRAMYERLHGGAVAWPQEMADVVEWYLPHLERLHDHPAPRRADLVQLSQLAAGHSSRDRFLTDLTLDPPQATSDDAGPPSRDEDHLILSTIHSAKGQEWHAVTVLNAVDGCIPSDLSAGELRQLEEERRLFHVALTRARHDLHVMVPLRFHVRQQAKLGDTHLYGGLTRFVPPAVEALFEPVVSRRVPETAGAAAELPAQLDLTKGVLDTWE